MRIRQAGKEPGAWTFVSNPQGFGEFSRYLLIPPPPNGSPVKSAEPSAEQPLAPSGAPVQIPASAAAEPVSFPAPTPDLMTEPLPANTDAPLQGAQGVPAPAKVKKRSKKFLIISLSAVVVVILVVAGFLVIPERLQSNAYDRAVAQFEAGDYPQAQESFEALGDYRDSAVWAQTSSDYVLYENAQSLYENGDYAAAKAMFESIIVTFIPNIPEWIHKCDYGIADDLYRSGDLDAAYDAFTTLGDFLDSPDRANQCKYDIADAYFSAGEFEDAYYAFKELSNFMDSAARATACRQPLPPTGVLYQAEGSYYALCAIEIIYNYSANPSLYKVYNGDTLVATLFLNPRSTARVHVQPGTYVVEECTGIDWFGPELEFGEVVSRSTTLTVNASGATSFNLGDGDLMTITLGSNANTDTAAH